jgi:TolB-like protein/DNA-binding winged helix-turn-helix (wHTH) protein/Flp pilus assembly protein TadD
VPNDHLLDYDAAAHTVPEESEPDSFGGIDSGTNYWILTLTLRNRRVQKECLKDSEKLGISSVPRSLIRLYNGSVSEEIAFGEAGIRPASRELFVRGTKAKLPWRTFDVLRLLVLARGEVVPKEELLRQVWGAEFVNDSNLTQAIAQIRKVLDPPTEGKSYVETVPRIGYRLSTPPVFAAAPQSNNLSVLVNIDPRQNGRIRSALRRVVVLLLPGVVLGAVLGLWTVRQRPREVRITNRSIAVLPLENLSSDPEQEYLVTEVTNALSLNLAKVRALRVAPGISAGVGRIAREAPAEIGRKLGVDYVLQGTVVRNGDHARITSRLIATASGRPIWAESYDRHLQDIPALELEMCRVIAHEIRVQLTPQDRIRLSSVRPVIGEAYEAYLKGRYYQSKRTETGLKKSIAFFEEAVSKDPGYGQAFAGLADSHTYMANHGFLAPHDAAPKAKAMAAKALEIDDKLAEAHTSLAYIKMVYDWDWAGAESEFRRSIELDPSYAKAHSLFACYFALQRRFDEALAEVRLALKLDPLSIYDNHNLGSHLLAARRYSDAVDQYRRTIDMDPASAQTHYGLGRALEQQGLYSEAIEEFKEGISLADGTPSILAGLAHAYAISGRPRDARRVMDRLRALSSRKYVPSYEMAIVYTGLGNQTEAFVWLEKAYRDRDGYLWLWLNLDQRFDSLRRDPRFGALVDRMRLPR